MRFETEFKETVDQIATLFEETFTASEGAEEGKLVSTLARDLMATTPSDDLFVFTAWQSKDLVGAIMFSRMTYSQDDRCVFLLSPVAVHTQFQGKHIGQQLLTHGLSEIARQGVEVALTYGDPKYYSQVGFQPITVAQAAAPYTLSYPHGWQANLLNSKSFTPLKGSSSCVAAMSHQSHW